MRINKILTMEAEQGFFESFLPLSKREIKRLQNEGFKVRIENNIFKLIFGCTVSWKHCVVLTDEEIFSGYIDCLSPNYSFSEELWIISMRNSPRPKDSLNILAKSF